MTTNRWHSLEEWEGKHGPMTFGRFVKVFREADRFSQSDYARKLKISRANLCDIEKGRRPVTFALATKVAKVLKVSEMLLLQLAIQDQLRREKLRYRVELKSA